MKKLIISLMLVASVLVGCSNNESVEAPNINPQIEINEVVKDDRVVELTFTVDESANELTLMNILKSVANVDDEDGFIISVDELIVTEGSREFIGFYVNGEMAMQGAKDLVLKSGDEVSLILETWK